jgi:hypothetical protein
MVNPRILLTVCCLSVALNVAFGGLYAYHKLNPPVAPVPRTAHEKQANADSPPAERKPQDKPRRNANPRCILDELKLDASQRQRLAKMRKRIWQKRDRFHARVDQIRRLIAQRISRPNPAAHAALPEKTKPNGPPVQTARKRIQILVERLSRLQADFRMEVVDHLLAVKAMLNAAQRTHFARLLEKRIFTGMRRFRKRPSPRSARSN